MPIDSGGLHPSNSLKHPLTAEARYWEYPKKSLGEDLGALNSRVKNLGLLNVGSRIHY